MAFISVCKLNISILTILCCACPAFADFQAAWDNPNANMAAGSIQPGYANLTWSTGTVLPIKTRTGMATLVTLPAGEKIADVVVGNDGLFNVDTDKGSQTMYITPESTNQGNDTNMIVTGQSGNKYIFYLRAYPINSSEISYSQVDISLGNGGVIAGTSAAPASNGSMGSLFAKNNPSQKSVIGVDGEDYGWIKTMKIDPAEFRFDLDIFVPNPDDYVIAPERVWRDRIFTYIDFGDKVISMTQRPVVALLVEGGESPVSFRTDGEDGRLLIVEAVGDMVLRSGQRIVCIKKREKPFLIADTASVMALAEANVAQSMMANQSLNSIAYTNEQYAINANYNDYTTTPTMVYNQPMGYTMPAMSYGAYGSANGVNMIPTERVTAGSYLPQSNIPLIASNQGGVAVELKSDTSVKALNDYWNDLLAKFSGDDGNGILSPYKNSVFFAVDEHGVGDLGAEAATARLYRLRIGPLSDIDSAQKLCDQLLKFSGASCHVVRIQ
jgi:type IV secretory pathway VirB9-like protein